MFSEFYLGFTRQDFLQRQEEFSVGAVQPGNVTNEHPYTKALIDFLSTHIFTSPALHAAASDPCRADTGTVESLPQISLCAAVLGILSSLTNLLMD